jgi:membrane protease YdiL (CAAX protease family)
VNPLQLSAILAVLCVALLALTGRIPYVVEFHSLWRRAVAALLFTLILAVAVFLPVATPVPGDFDPQHLWFPLVFLTHIPLTLFLVVWWRLRGDVSLAGFLSISTENLSERLRQGLWYGAGCWFFAIAATVTMGNFAETVGNYSPPLDPPAIIAWMAGLSLMQKLAVVVVSMTVEEAFFRGFLQPRVGLVPASILFALGHFSYDMPMLLIGVFAVSLVIGRCFERTGNLLPCIVAHGVFNGIQLLVVLPLVVDSWGAAPL